MAGRGFSFSGDLPSSFFGFSNPSPAGFGFGSGTTSSAGFGFGSGATSSAAASPFGGFSLNGTPAATSSATASPFGGSTLFGSTSTGEAPASSLFGPSGTAPNANLFRSSSTPSPSPSGTSAPFGTPVAGPTNLSGAPTLGVSLAASASSTCSHPVGPASSGSPPVSSPSSSVSTTFVTSTSAAPPSASSAPQAQSAAACVEACSSEGALKHEAAFVADKQSSKVVRQSSENSPEVLVKNELGHPAHGGISSVDVQMNSSLQNTLSPAKTHLIEQILRKHGDITKGSILRSTEAKTCFLQLVAEVVERLQSHTLGTVRAHDIITMQKWTDDAVAVGFNVEWLQQRIKRVTAISKFQYNSTRLTEISEKVEAARIALWEMELQEMIVKKEMDFVKADMDTEVFCRSNLCEGLF